MPTVLRFALPLLVFLSTSTVAAEEIVVVFGSRGVEIAGVTPGAEVVLFGVGRDPRTPGAERFHVTVHDDDGDGTVSWQRSTPLPPILVLGATEFETGNGQMAARGWRPGSRWNDPGSEALELFFLRPGERDWATRVTHHQLALAGSLRPLLGSIAPDTRQGDVLIAIDLSTLRSARMRVPAEGPGAAVNRATAGESGRSARLLP